MKKRVYKRPLTEVVANVLSLFLLKALRLKISGLQISQQPILILFWLRGVSLMSR